MYAQYSAPEKLLVVDSLVVVGTVTITVVVDSVVPSVELLVVVGTVTVKIVVDSVVLVVELLVVFGTVTVIVNL